MDYDEHECDPKGHSTIRVRNELKIRLYRLSQAWSGVNRKRLSLHNVIEILAKLVPGKLTDEEIASVELSTKPPGRPKFDLSAERKITCLQCLKNLTFEDAYYRAPPGSGGHLKVSFCSDCLKTMDSEDLDP